MRPKRLVLCCLTFSLLALAAKNERDWKTGKVAESESSTRSKEIAIGSRRVDVEMKNLVIVGGEYIYTAQDTKKLRRGWCRVIVGDEIKYVQDKDKLYVLDADGKECRLDIVRQERRQ